jgi:RNA polymerase sigma-70 factor (ECF subfamily)
VPFPQRARILGETNGSEDPAARWQRLMIAAQAGDQRCYAALLREASMFIRVVARRFHSDAAMVEDVVQETLLSIHRIRHTYEPGRPVEPWVAAIARARSIDALRARKRRAARESALPDDVTNIATPDVDQLVVGSDVVLAIEALPPSQRAALRMVKLEEMSLAEAAQASGRSVSAIKSLVHRAMNALRVVLRSDNRA